MEPSSWKHQQEPGVTDGVSAEHHPPMPQRESLVQKRWLLLNLPVVACRAWRIAGGRGGL